jgi:hypothetical protein
MYCLVAWWQSRRLCPSFKAPADPSKAGINFNARLKFRVDMVACGSKNRSSKKDEKSIEFSEVSSEGVLEVKGGLSFERWLSVMSKVRFEKLESSGTKGGELCSDSRL